MVVVTLMPIVKTNTTWQRQIIAQLGSDSSVLITIYKVNCGMQGMNFGFVRCHYVSEKAEQRQGV